MDSIIHEGLSHLEEELKKLDSALMEERIHTEEFSSIEETSGEIKRQIINLESIPKDKFSSKELKLILSKIDNIRYKLMSSEINILDNNSSLKKDLIDEIGMVIIGLNNLNHFIADSANQNERLFIGIEEKINKIETKNKLLIITIFITLIIVIFQFLIFFR